MYIIVPHPSLTLLSSLPLTWSTCDEGVDYRSVAKLLGVTILVAVGVISLWWRLVSVNSAWRSIAAFLVAFTGMTCWIYAVFVAVLLFMLLVASGALAVLPPLVLALAVALLGIAAVECPPMRRTAWRDWRDQPRWQRIGLLSGLGYLGLSLPFILILMLAEADKFNCY